jgi:GT2 family glycosyltransferase
MTDGATLSVVIPTRDRTSALARTLDALEAQGDAEVEVIVVVNGPVAAGRELVRRRARAATISIRLLDRPEAGPAAARNAGAEAAVGDVLLFLGDDTEPAGSGLARAHLDLHSATPDPAYGVLGRITWTHRAPITPFMIWLENGGPQFNYGDLAPGPVDAASYFYSSHASVKREMFDRVGGFDPRFPSAAVEDTELGTRLADAGLVLDYHPELVVLHDHPMTLPQARRRAVTVGRSAALYNRLRPDRPHPRVQPPNGPAWNAVRLAEPLLAGLARGPLPPGPRERLWLALIHAGYARGYRLGW